MIYAPVVLNVGSIGNVIPVTAGMDGIFFITLGIAQQEVCKVIPFGIRRRSCEAAVEVEVSLSKSKIVLNFLV